ncbi:MAG: hypothetical protein SGILL_009566, partial [Bacillariaceae sp.]
MSQPATVGLGDTLRKYYREEQSKAKRRKLKDSASRDDAVDRFVDLSAAPALSKSLLTRTRKVYLKETKKSTKESEAKSAEISEQQKDETTNSAEPEPKDQKEHFDLTQQDIEAIDQQEKQVLADMKAIENAKKQVYKDQVEVWGVYKYGLQHVKELTDLSAAPDAILP